MPAKTVGRASAGAGTTHALALPCLLRSGGSSDMAARRDTRWPGYRTLLHAQSVPPLNEIEVLEGADRAGLQGIASANITQ